MIQAGTYRLRHFLKANSTLDDQTLDHVLTCFKTKLVKKNSLILSAGELCRALHFVHKGCIRTYYISANGAEKTRYIALDGSIGTSISGFISQKPSPEFVDALEDTQLWSISFESFFRLTKELPEWAAFYTKLLESAYLYQNARIESLVTLTAKERFENILAQHPSFITRLSNKVLASYLDMTQETLSRLKSI